VARWQALSRHKVTALNHMTIDFQDELARGLARLCDGTRTRDVILAELRAQVARAPGTLTEADITPETLELTLRKLATYGLLLS
jgi:hypothetical protein